MIHARVGMFVFNVLWTFDSLFDAVEAMFDFLVEKPRIVPTASTSE